MPPRPSKFIRSLSGRSKVRTSIPTSTADRPDPQPDYDKAVLVSCV
jgi:hypothetical protein